jgi:hypothetical protein
MNNEEKSIAKPRKKSPRRESKTSKRRLEILQKEDSALQMRMAGASFSDIALALRYKGRSGSFRAVEASLKRREPASVQMARELNLERLNRMRSAYWGNIQPEDPGKFVAINSELAVQNREASLMGLDAPKVNRNLNTNFTVSISYEDPVIDDSPVGEIPIEIPIITDTNSDVDKSQ